MIMDTNTVLIYNSSKFYKRYSKVIHFLNHIAYTKMYLFKIEVKKTSILQNNVPFSFQILHKTNVPTKI